MPSLLAVFQNMSTTAVPALCWLLAWKHEVVLNLEDGSEAGGRWRLYHSGRQVPNMTLLAPGPESFHCVIWLSLASLRANTGDDCSLCLLKGLCMKSSASPQSPSGGKVCPSWVIDLRLIKVNWVLDAKQIRAGLWKCRVSLSLLPPTPSGFHSRFRTFN